MFGYMKLDSKCPNTLRNHYKKYYCYLCRSLGKHYGIFSRMILSYDVTFFMLFISESSFLNNINKIPCVRTNNELKTTLEDEIGHKCAAMNLLLVSAKLDDDILDEGKLSSRIVKSIYSHKIKKAEKEYPELTKTIYDGYKSFREFESNNDSLKSLEISFSLMMTNILTHDFGITDEAKLKTLNAASKWLYYIDAIDDLDKDIKDNCFNPLKSYKTFNDLRNNHYMDVYNHLSDIFSNTGIPESNEANDIIINRLLYHSIPETTSRILNRRSTK